MSDRRAKPLWPTLLAIGLCLFAAYAAASRLTLGFRAWTTEDARRIRVAEHPATVADPLVVASDGRTRTLWNSDPRARAWLVTFMYTRCLSICSVTGTEFRQLQDRIGDEAPGVRLASVSFDPAHDTPSALADYGRRHGADARVWTIAAPADDAALRRLLDETGVVVIHDGMGGYAHNAAIHVIVPPGRLVRIFPMEKYREALAFAERIGR
ncbi:MAG TPA: SCO family protein [Usitatibacter sp.]